MPSESNSGPLAPLASTRARFSPPRGGRGSDYDSPASTGRRWQRQGRGDAGGEQGDKSYGEQVPWLEALAAPETLAEREAPGGVLVYGTLGTSDGDDSAASSHTHISRVRERLNFRIPLIEVDLEIRVGVRDAVQLRLDALDVDLAGDIDVAFHAEARRSRAHIRCRVHPGNLAFLQSQTRRPPV